MKKGLLNSFQYENEEVKIIDSNSYGYTVELNNGKILDGIKKSAITFIEDSEPSEIVLTVADEDIHIDRNTKKILFVRIGKRKYKSSRYINNFYYKSIVEEYFKKF